jgi:hypothetical protein
MSCVASAGDDLGFCVVGRCVVVLPLAGVRRVAVVVLAV